MSLDTSKIETLTPSQFITFTIPNSVEHRCNLRTPLLRVALLDSPIAVSDGVMPSIAAMVVPDNRESDWIFCTESGHYQLLLNFPNLSRLVVIGNNPPLNTVSSIYIRPPEMDTVEKEKLEEELKPLVLALHPKACFENGEPQPVFVTYDDSTVYRVTIESFVGPVVGEFLVEDVELESDDATGRKDLRRRLRFKRTPNWIQSQVSLIPTGDGVAYLGFDLQSLRKMNKVQFKVDTENLIHPYLTPMITGILLIASHIDELFLNGLSPRALCLGVGAGALLSYLNTQLGFDVVGVEADSVVLDAARKYFGFHDGGSIRTLVGDAIELMGKVSSRGIKRNSDDIPVDIEGKFDVVMVDLDSNDVKIGVGAPPPEFVRNPVFKAAKFVLHDLGVLIINVVLPDVRFYGQIVQELKNNFPKVYEIKVENEDNTVLVAAMSPIAAMSPTAGIVYENAFLKKMSLVSDSHMKFVKEL